MIERILELLNSLSEDAQNAIIKKCKELGFDPNKGDISLEESFINLNSARAILKESIAQSKLIQLPLSVQKNLLPLLENIQRLQAEIINGTDQVVNLVNVIEALHFAVWTFGLHKLSGEVLGLETKMNQLKQLELDATKLKAELQDGLRVKESLDKIQTQASDQAASLHRLLGESHETLRKINDNLSTSSEANQKVGALLQTIQQSDVASSQFSANAKASQSAVAAIENKIQEFLSQIDTYRDKLVKMSTDAENTVAEHSAETGRLISQLKELEDLIKLQIQKATGFSLFHSFQTRKESLVKSKQFWIYAIVGLICISLGFTGWIISTVPETLDTAFYLKLTISIPIIFLITFCTLQYSRERRLEEEYAFKSNISISLIPYQELVDKLTDKSKQAERDRYATFIIESIGKVFSSPTDKVFEDRSASKLSMKSLKEFTDIFEQMQKLLKP
ncbi:conserved protein of unknown function [Nitrospira japonica]|uniref:Uncharacterized protein n=1 Tax=Nitrospira japonica TaxID=1325564 RepID=A0A1W1I510_9BACT|nr:hypothetical protein [Nitrospira japonica]SLM48086.1 conserved protein of unknown function [Nitrospira japonica]